MYVFFLNFSSTDSRTDNVRAYRYSGLSQFSPETDLIPSFGTHPYCAHCFVLLLWIAVHVFALSRQDCWIILQVKNLHQKVATIIVLIIGLITEPFI